MTSYFHKAKVHDIQGQLNRRYHLTYTPGHVSVQFNLFSLITYCNSCHSNAWYVQVVCISRTYYFLALRSYK